ncbi:MAG: rRNA maturation RNase YbeY [Clostridia bacterium]|nr:rRNA maturation RNase YbeY [Clostridia bacterium]
MKTKILFQNEQDKFKITLKLKSIIKKAVKGTLRHEGVGYDTEISVTFTDNEGIRELNLEHREKDSATDVLSFPMYTFAEGDVPFEGECAELGDIVLSLERADEQSREFGHSFKRECAFLTVHSMLHLLGYDHETSEEDEKEMFAIQNEIMNEIGITRD